MVNHPPAHNAPTGLRPSAARRQLSIAVLVTLFLAIGIPTSPTKAATPLATLYVLPKLEAKPQGSLILCPGEKLWIYVSYSETTYRITSGVGPPTQGPDEAGKEIEGSVSNPAVGRLLNPKLGTRSYRGLVVAPFVFQSQDLGDTTITFDEGDPLASLVPAAVVRVQLSPVTVDVHVGCKFQVVAFSDWLFTWGFRPRANAILDAMLIPDRNGVIPDVSVPVQNVTRKTVSICANEVEVGGSNAKASGQLDVRRGRLNVTLDYGNVTGSAWIRCPSVFIPVFGQSFGDGKPQKIQTNPISIAVSTSAAAAGQVVPHIVESYRNVSGSTTIVVSKLSN